MKFTGLDRIALLYSGVMPAESNRMILGMTDDFQQAINFTAEELKEIQYTALAEGRFSYTVEKAYALVIDVELPQLLGVEIWKKLEELDKANRLTFAMVPLYDKFQKWIQEPGFA